MGSFLLLKTFPLFFFLPFPSLPVPPLLSSPLLFSPHPRIYLLILEREEEGREKRGSVAPTPIRTLTGNQAHNVLVYRTMLQPTGPGPEDLF